MGYKQYLNTKYWKNLRKKIFKRKGKRCYICFNDKRTNVHHRAYVDKNGKSILYKEKTSTLIPLCPKCHGLFHKYHKMNYLSLSSFFKAQQYYLKTGDRDYAIRFCNNLNVMKILNGKNYIYGDCFEVQFRQKLKFNGNNFELKKGNMYFINELGYPVNIKNM